MSIQIRLILMFTTIFSFLYPNEWKTVYLASFPRSGNHWVRYLVEEATHIVTSSVYPDVDFPKPHLNTIFPWRGYCPDHGYKGNCEFPRRSDPVLIKTHYPFYTTKIEPNPKKTICLIRNPIDSFWSLYIYQNTFKGDSSHKIDKKILSNFINKWREFYDFWENEPNTIFIRYEDLQLDTKSNLLTILETAGFSFNESDIDRAVMEYPSEGKPLKHITHFDSEDLDLIKTELAEKLIKFGYFDF